MVTRTTLTVVLIVLVATIAAAQRGGRRGGGFSRRPVAFASLSDRGWKAYDQAKMPKFYFDLGKHRDAQAKGQTPFTPTMSVFFGLDIALDRMAAEGLESIFTRHKKIGTFTRAGIKKLGLELLCEDERFASDTVTAVKCPEGIEVSALRNAMEDNYNIILAGGQGKLSGKIFRIGHLGLVQEEDISSTLEALGETLGKLGFKS